MGDLPSYFGGVAVILLLTSFVKIFTSLSIVRVGMGLDGIGFGLVILPVAFVLSMLVAPKELRTDGYPMSVFDSQRSPTEVESIFRPLMEKHAETETTDRLMKIVAPAKEDKKAEEKVPVPFDVLIASFLLTELKEAFRIGFIILVPFLVIDLLTVNVMMALGIQQMAHSVVAIPLKLLLFTAVNGWALLADKLLSGYS